MHIEGMTINEIQAYLVKIAQEEVSSYKLAELKWIKDNDIRVGSQVKILAYVCNNPEIDSGWNECWVEEMDSFVGDTYSIDAVRNNDKGLSIRGWNFPFFVLEKK